MSDAIDLSETLITLTADIVSAHVSNNNVAVGEVSGLIQQIHAALSQLGQPAGPPPPRSRSPRSRSGRRSSPTTSSASRTARSSRCSSAT